MIKEPEAIFKRFLRLSMKMRIEREERLAYKNFYSTEKIFSWIWMSNNKKKDLLENLNIHTINSIDWNAVCKNVVAVANNNKKAIRLHQPDVSYSRRL